MATFPVCLGSTQTAQSGPSSGNFVAAREWLTGCTCSVYTCTWYTGSAVVPSNSTGSNRMTPGSNPDLVLKLFLLRLSSTLSVSWDCLRPRSVPSRARDEEHRMDDVHTRVTAWFQLLAEEDACAQQFLFLVNL